MKILVTDDNAQNRYLLQQLLLSAGHECLLGANGAEGLTHVRAKPCDIIISDILMPEMDGFQFCREVMADEALRRIPFIFYTATYTEPGDEKLGLSLGAVRYLIKPAEPEAILAALDEVMQNRAPAATEALPADEVFLKQYNARLVEKLEHKMLQLEQANTELLKTNAALGDEISRRFAAEKAARAACEVQRATLESTADAILAVDGEGTVAACNHAFIELWKLTTPPRDLSTLMPRLAVQTAKPAELTETWGKLAAGRSPRTSGMLGMADGRTVEWAVLPLHAPDGRPGWVWTCRDITERIREEDTRRSMQAQLHELQKMEALGVLAGGVAHDFNNVLTAIMGQTSLASTRLADDHEAQESLQAVMAASHRAAELVRQILTFSRRQEPKRVNVKVRPLVLDALKFLQSTLPAGVVVETDLAGGDETVRADPTQLHQVLINLATNASHAMNGRGRLQISTRIIPAGGDAPTELLSARCVVLTVKDNGVGMDEATRRRIFEPFFTTKAPGEGTGLGLAVVHGIVKNNGGVIQVTSSPGAGAEFRVYLPATGGAVETSEATLRTSVLRGNGERILVAEDNEAVRNYLRELLAGLGYQTTCCNSAEDALSAFERSPTEYAALVTDLSMRGMTGLELLKAARAIRPGLPAVVLTGYFNADAAERGARAADYELLLKPCSAETIGETLHRVLRIQTADTAQEPKA